MSYFSEKINKDSKLWDLYMFAVSHLLKAYAIVSPKKASKRRFKKSLGYEYNEINPKTLNEKLMYLKLEKYLNNQAIASCADKYAVRKFVHDHGCADTLTKLYGVWDKAEDIEWDKLPERFAIKCNHGSGYNIVCTNKSELDLKKAKADLNAWLKEKYGYKAVEQGIYKGIKPHIIAEEYIETSDGHPPKDYKFFCSYGEVKFLFVASDRYDNKTKFDYYWPDWTYIPVRNYFPNGGVIDKPAGYEKMIQCAKMLSKNFPLVRVDFYYENDKVYFGELTFTHFGCVQKFTPEKYDLIFGETIPNVDVLKKWSEK